MFKFRYNEKNTFWEVLSERYSISATKSGLVV